MSQFLISAAHKSSGKTTLSIGLCAAFAERGLHVQPFKKGPDYIDPMWLSAASGQNCYNLDFFTMSDEEISALYESRISSSDIAIIEGNKGLYDGMDLEGSNSNAALAKHLDVPVILVLDTRGTIRGVAPLLLGYQEFDRNVSIAGVILNQVGGPRHEKKLLSVIERYTDIPVLGSVYRNDKLSIVERHLGLIPNKESSESGRLINDIRDAIKDQVALDAILDIGNPAPENAPAFHEPAEIGCDITIAIARDEAFNFYYPDDLEKFSELGINLVNFSPIHDRVFPECDGLFIGGGFPETHMQQLSENISMRKSIYDEIESGLPVYAECGGLMYLCRSITWDNRKFDMAGVIAGDIVLHDKPIGRGYTILSSTNNNLWLKENGKNPFNAHEFHYSSLTNIDNSFDYSYAYNVVRGFGIDGKHDGLVYKNMTACYSHQRNSSQNEWVVDFVNFIKTWKTSEKEP